MTCMACGFEGYDADVKMRLVDLVDEGYVEADLPRQNVELPASVARRPPDVVEVPQRYVREPRCRDKLACRRRVDDYERMARAAEIEANPPEPEPEPEVIAPTPTPVKEELAWTI